MSTTLVASAWAEAHAANGSRVDNKLRGLRDMGQTLRAGAQGRGTCETWASTYQGTALALGRTAAIANPGSGFELNADFGIMRRMHPNVKI